MRDAPKSPLRPQRWSTPSLRRRRSRGSPPRHRPPRRPPAPPAPTARLAPAARVGPGFLTAAFPDIDFVLGYVSPVAFLTGHRGVTHSILLLPVWAVLLAWIMAKIDRGKAVTWRDYLGVCALGVGVHIVGDLITSFGTMIYAPLSDARVAWN